ncbi:TonB-dependent receptor [Aquimarina addita]|uniref:TonB-dependent receptor n=1 Tax=Aquimarina addita TaxID=870485 RepID=A0ABP7X960_9FLAO
MILFLSILKPVRSTFGLFVIIVFGLHCGAIAQDDDEQTLETERVVIVKAYTPTISDAFKVKSTPVLNDSVTQKKKQIRYSIFSVPVASTFTPAKGKAENIDKPQQIPLYDNYATLGVGNFTSVLAEFYSNFQLNRTDNVGLYLHHNSSQGGIEDVVLDDKFYNTFLDLNYTSRTKDFVYGIEVGAEHQLYNWYGLPDIPVLTEEQLEGIDPQQNYFGGKLGGKFEFKDKYFNKVVVSYRYFGDALGSRENRFIATPTLEFNIADEIVTTNINIDYLGGGFERELQAGVLNDYKILNMGIQPNLLVLRDNLTLNLGAEIVYSVDSQRENNSFHIYPNVTASYRLLGENVIAYGGLEGGLKQNTYRDAVQINPYVSPTLEIRPTDNQFDTYVGLKGKVYDMVSYNFRGSLRSEKNKAVLVHNDESLPQLEGYDFQNSFSYRYDDINTISAYGELNFSITKKFTLGATAEYFNYSTDNEEAAWNLPEIKASIITDYQITEQWFAGAQLFFVGERRDVDTSVLFTPPASEPSLTLDSYFDANINIGYRFNEKLSVFVKGNNLAGENYERWTNYPVQGIQVLGGLTYKFNY